jgi:hypothetical protein
MIRQLILSIRRTLLGAPYAINGYQGYSPADYFDTINLIDSHLSTISKLLEIPLKYEVNIRTKTEFKPYDIEFGISQKKMLRICGKPNHKIDNELRLSGCKVYFFKKRIGGIKLSTQLHFFQDSLFLAKTEFSGRSSNEGLKEKIFNLTLKKYTETEKHLYKEILSLEDSKNNTLLMDMKNVYPSITYLSGDKETIGKVISLIREKKTERVSKEKLTTDELFKKL